MINVNSANQAFEELCNTTDKGCIKIVPSDTSPDDFASVGWGGSLPTTMDCKVLTVIYEDGSNIFKALNGASPVFYSTRQEIVAYSANRISKINYQFGDYMEFEPIKETENVFYSWDEFLIPEGGIWCLGFGIILQKGVGSPANDYIIFEIYKNGNVLDFKEEYDENGNPSIGSLTFPVYYENIFEFEKDDIVKIKIDIKSGGTPYDISLGSDKNFSSVWIYRV